jgi:hypothetical protein
MPDDIFISYSRRDLEFVTRLASDLDAKVAGVWFDKSDIRAGQRWRDSIAEGIRACKAVVLVLRPMQPLEARPGRDQPGARGRQNHYPRALPRGRAGGPGRPGARTQTIDLRRGSYAENFQILVDGLIAAGAVRQT